jgi:glycosyltransferase involved in cell wall biosynthesis
MKFSVLIPTRNRLELLRYAVDSVRAQDYADWEVIISDNCSDEPIGGFVQGLSDRRIVYSRSDRFLPVTDNWNRALGLSTGRYVIMLGDDDALLRGYFRRMLALIEQFDAPDAIYTEAVQFGYPGVMPGHEAGFVQFGYCAFMRGGASPYLLDRNDALRCVEASLSFRVAFGYNMQHTLVDRRLIERMHGAGPFYQSPYPDYYASNAIFLKALQVVVDPRPAVAIGISPKSFGYFYFNAREGEGTSFLHNVPDSALVSRVKDVVLPGTDMNTSWLLSMEALHMNYPKEASRPVYWRYRFLQLRRMYEGRHSLSDFLLQLFKVAKPWEQALWVLLAFAGVVLFGRVRRILDWIHISHPYFDARRRAVPYQNIRELFTAVDPSSLSAGRAQ